MGSVKATRNAFKTAYEKWQKEPKAYRSRQEVFAEMFGEQEYQRELIRSQHLTATQRFSRWWSGSTSFLDTHTIPISMQGGKTSFEHGISLDYTSSLAQVVSSASSDADWIRYNDPKTLFTAASTLNITIPPQNSIQKDIAHSRPPFFSLAPIT
ncbi:MAG: hypothetical protein Q9164_007798, partial [Protoblastenia rupestris]